MDNYVLPEETLERIKKQFADFDKLSEKQLESIIDSLLSHIKQAGPGLIQVLEGTSSEIKKNPAKAMESLEVEITKKMMEILIYFKILKDSTNNIASLKIYLKIITNLIPFFMEKLGLMGQDDMAMTPLIFALSEGDNFAEGDNTPKKEKRNSEDVRGLEQDIMSLMDSIYS